MTTSELPNSRMAQISSQHPRRKVSKFANARLQGLSESVRAWYTVYILETLFRQNPLPPSKEGRHVPLDVCREHGLIDERTGHAYCSNAIRSSRYTIYDFLPKQFIFQATRLSNFYFICIGVPQTIPGISTTGSYTTILPLLFFIVLTIAKEGYDDYRRHRLDNVENRRRAVVLRRHQDSGNHNIGWRSRLRPLFRRKVEVDESTGLEGDIGGDHQWISIEWQHIQVGDVLALRRDDSVPADIVLLYAEGEDRVAYVETMALDGETSLKNRQALRHFNSCNNIQGLAACRAELTLEDPNADLYSFNGKFNIEDTTVPLTLNEIILRGSVLRNTNFVVGLVINTGEECKIRMNANHHPEAKKPYMEKTANKIVGLLVLYVIVLTAGCSIGYYLWQRSTEGKSYYLNGAFVDYKDIIIGYAIEFNNVIPLALYISLEIVRIGQALLLHSDIEMYDAVSDTPMRCNTNTILENLGQIRYILSDKTGTLTQNVMKFRKMSVGGLSFLHRPDDPMSPGTEVNSKGQVVTTVSEEKSSMRQPLRNSKEQSRARTVEIGESSSAIPLPSYPSVQDPSEYSTQQLIRHIRSQPNSPFSRKAHNFILAMAVCHTCLPEVSDGSVSFQGSSPDEVALVQAAYDMSYIVVHRSSQYITVTTEDDHGEKRKNIFEYLDIIEFSSGRKRMSVCLRCPDGRVWIICKGADNVVHSRLRCTSLEGQGDAHDHASFERGRGSFYERKSHDLSRRSDVARLKPENKAIMDLRTTSLDLRRRSKQRTSLDIRPVSFDVSRITALTPSQWDAGRLPVQDLNNASSLDDATVLQRCLEDTDEFATDGLRTLLYADKTMSYEKYSEWRKGYLQATTALIDRQSRIEDAAESIERDLDLLGASAIEDKLQDGVPETIEKLRRAKIRVWMLTGDKRETAINIAHSAGICRANSDLFILDAKKSNVSDQIQALGDDLSPGLTHSVVVIDGHTLAEIEADRLLKDRFYSTIPLIDSVICCRATPSQKAHIVEEIRHRNEGGGLTLAIGDGANDIAMIQTAHVGIGISGKEGLQAARVADFSISQFRFLQRLLLVHGRWCYSRIAKFILLTFWKEFFFYMMQALYQRYNGYTGTSLYESTSLTVLNTLFTSLCVIVPGIYEQDLKANTLLAIPELYVYGQRNEGLNIYKFFMWTAGATATGMVVWFASWAAYGVYDFMGDDGLFALGDLSFSLGIVWTNWKILIIETHYKTVIVLGSFLITVGGWWVWNVFLSAIYTPGAGYYAVRNGFLVTFGPDPIWWLTLLWILILLAASDAVYKYFSRRIHLGGAWSRFRKTDYSAGDQNDRWDLQLWQELEQYSDSALEKRDMRHAQHLSGSSTQMTDLIDGSFKDQHIR